MPGWRSSADPPTVGAMTTIARRVRVHGRVQGVFFRDSCDTEARRHGVAGWITNEPDGTVAAWFEGDPDGVDALVAWGSDGPPHAKVARVDVDEVEPEGHGDFAVR